MSSSRQLAAIMFTDIVGYTALMGKDSGRALEMVRQSRAIQKPLVEKYKGKWLKEMGDGALAKFGAALDAVNCAVDIQRAMGAEFDGKIRIGIHSGDITLENEDVYGDGVNVASRLESIADPGGIYISESIEKAIHGQTRMQIRYLGELRLKNVSYGVRTYAIQGEGLPIPQINEDNKLSGHFLSELSRRGVLRTALSYALFSLLLILIMREAGNWFAPPGWTVSILGVVFALFFPIAMILAWYFEWGPKGLVRTTSAQSWQNPYPVGRRKPLTGNWIMIGMVLAIIMYFAYTYSIKPSRSAPSGYTGSRSIAVLPFANLSADPEQEYFSDGITVELINALARKQDLKVIAKTSSFVYKGRNVDLRDIGNELNVGLVLDGSVTKYGEDLAITVQLVNTENGYNLWSDRYEVQMGDVFNMLDNITSQVLHSVETEESDGETLKASVVSTANSDAYNLYLRAKFLSGKYDQEAFESSNELLKEAIDLDPDFIEALALLGWNYDLMGSIYGTLSPTEAFSSSVPYFQMALKIDSNNYEALAGMALAYMFYKQDYIRSEDYFQRAIKVSHWPSAPSSICFCPYIMLMAATGRSDIALDALDKYFPLDPVFARSTVYVGLLLYLNGEVEKSLQHFDRAMKLRKHFDLNYFLSTIYMDLKDFINAQKQIDQVFQKTNIRDGILTAYLSTIYYSRGEVDKAAAMLDKIGDLERDYGRSFIYAKAIAHNGMGDSDTALSLLKQAIESGEKDVFKLRIEPGFKNLRGNEDFERLIHELGLYSL